MKGRNPNTRAILGALQCDYQSLRVAAVEIVDTALKLGGSEQQALMSAFDCHRNTALKILRARARVTKSGKEKR